MRRTGTAVVLVAVAAGAGALAVRMASGDPAATPSAHGAPPRDRPNAVRVPRVRAHAEATEAAEREFESLRTSSGALREAVARERARAGERVLPDGSVVAGDGRNGVWSQRSRDGRLRSEGTFAEGRRNGLWVEHGADGSRTEIEYRDGVKHGREATWFPDGTPRFLGRNDDGRPAGTWTSWHANGQIRSTREYVDGKVHGVMRTFHANGTVETESVYASGRDSGPTLGWHDDGSPEFVVPYHDGRRQGEAVWYHRSGPIAARGTYVDGLLHGTYATWKPDGTPDSVEEWERGELVRTTSAPETAALPEEVPPR